MMKFKLDINQQLIDDQRVHQEQSIMPQAQVTGAVDLMNQYQCYEGTQHAPLHVQNMQMENALQSNAQALAPMQQQQIQIIDSNQFIQDQNSMFAQAQIQQMPVQQQMVQANHEASQVVQHGQQHGMDLQSNQN